MSTRKEKGPDKDMEKPKAYKSSIDAMKPQPTMSMDTRQTQYKPAKAIDFKNKIPEYKPKNDLYKTSFWEAPKRKMIQQPQKKNETPAPKPPPKQQPPKRAAAPPPKPKATNSLQPLPQPNFNSKKPPVVAPQPNPEPVPVEHWEEPMKTIPDLHPRIAPAPRENPFAGLPSTYGSMARMMSMFSR